MMPLQVNMPEPDFQCNVLEMALAKIRDAAGVFGVYF